MKKIFSKEQTEFIKKTAIQIANDFIKEFGKDEMREFLYDHIVRMTEKVMWKYMDIWPEHAKQIFKEDFGKPKRTRLYAKCRIVSTPIFEEVCGYRKPGKLK